MNIRPLFTRSDSCSSPVQNILQSLVRHLTRHPHQVTDLPTSLTESRLQEFDAMLSCLGVVDPVRQYLMRSLPFREEV